MGFRFRRSIKILPGVRVNIGKKGVSSVSIGKRGATVTTGKTGTHLNVGIPGTGVSYRTKLNDQAAQQKPVASLGKSTSLDTLEQACFLVGASLGFMSLFWFKDHMMILFALILAGIVALVCGFIGFIVGAALGGK